MLASDDFVKYMRCRFQGRLVRIDKWKDHDGRQWKVGLILHIPEHEAADEMEIYRRINRVIEVVCTGNEPEPNNVS